MESYFRSVGWIRGWGSSDDRSGSVPLASDRTTAATASLEDGLLSATSRFRFGGTTLLEQVSRWPVSRYRRSTLIACGIAVDESLTTTTNSNPRACPGSGDDTHEQNPRQTFVSCPPAGLGVARSRYRLHSPQKAAAHFLLESAPEELALPQV